MPGEADWDRPGGVEPVAYPFGSLLLGDRTIGPPPVVAAGTVGFSPTPDVERAAEVAHRMARFEGGRMVEGPPSGLTTRYPAPRQAVEGRG